MSRATLYRGVCILRYDILPQFRSTQTDATFVPVVVVSHADARDCYACAHLPFAFDAISPFTELVPYGTAALLLHYRGTAGT